MSVPAPERLTLANGVTTSDFLRAIDKLLEHASDLLPEVVGRQTEFALPDGPVSSDAAHLDKNDPVFRAFITVAKATVSPYYTEAGEPVSRESTHALF